MVKRKEWDEIAEVVVDSGLPLSQICSVANARVSDVVQKYVCHKNVPMAVGWKRVSVDDREQEERSKQVQVQLLDSPFVDPDGYLVLRYGFEVDLAD